ncbi:MAG: hypothetical protein RDV41_08010 [Planctomycetota bacterium]|nr:hypothetical protein [Planctomycetota bacterium]
MFERRADTAVRMLPALILVGLALGCATPPPGPAVVSEDSGPRELIVAFGRNLRGQEWKKAYLLLSKDTRKRYTPFHFRELFEKTKIGGLLFWQFTTWNLVDVRLAADGASGTFTFQHPVRAEFKREYRLVREQVARKEEDGAETTVNVWRLKFTIAELLNMPDEDEDAVFPPQ